MYYQNCVTLTCNCSWRVRGQTRPALALQSEIQCSRWKTHEMHPTRRLLGFLNDSYQTSTRVFRGRWQRISRPATTSSTVLLGSYTDGIQTVDGRRRVHSSVPGPWPNTQPHVLNGDSGPVDIRKLTTVQELRSWLETRKKEIYGMLGVKISE